MRMVEMREGLPVLETDVRSRAHGSRVNIIDVAVRAGVSPATVSRSLRGMAKVAPQTRQRVLEAAAELSYLPTTGAPGSGFGLHRSVAVIVPYINRWFFGTVTAAAVDLLRSHGYDVLLYHLGNPETRDIFFGRVPIDSRVEGILTLSMPLTEEHTLALRALDLPLVSVGTHIPGSPSVTIDEEAAASSAVNHLLQLKHTRIGYLGEEADESHFSFVCSQARRRGYENALRAAGISAEDQPMATGSHGPEGGAAAMAQMLTGPVLPTAIFAEYDELAIGALWALRKAGLKVPGDISIIGVDDHEMSTMLDLTTIAQNVSAQGEAAARLLLEVLQGKTHSINTTVRLPTRLILRGTTAPPAPTLNTPTALAHPTAAVRPKTVR